MVYSYLAKSERESDVTLLGIFNTPFMLSESESKKCKKRCQATQGWILDLVKGTPKNLLSIFANKAQWIYVNEMSPNWPGSRKQLRALEALGYFIAKYAFSPF